MILRLLASVALLTYSAWLMAAYDFHFLDHVNLAIHEAGHMVFSSFGNTLHALGGTILQLAAPLAFAINFVLRGRRFDAWVCVFWFGESLMYTAWYLADAYLMALPLVGGERHDWNFLLSRWGLVAEAQTIGGVLHWIAGGITLLAALGAGAVSVSARARRRREFA
ncbi:MAG: hypothetical protein DHS20C15_30420 [Planctomycetota bacterium]|nr:MAG: hypothetical protein DHS20C15_30420 [Planctomycetota bacterium]